MFVVAEYFLSEDVVHNYGIHPVSTDGGGTLSNGLSVSKVKTSHSFSL